MHLDCCIKRLGAAMRKMCACAQEEEAIEAAAREATTAELQRRAAAQAAWQLASRRSAIEWLRHPIPASTSKYIAEWLALLQDALDALHPETLNAPLSQQATEPEPVISSAPAQHGEMVPALASRAAAYPSKTDGSAAAALTCGGSSAEDPLLAVEEGSAHASAAAVRPPADAWTDGMGVMQNGHVLPLRPPSRADPIALTEALDALRELGSLHLTLPLLAKTDLLPTMQRLSAHPVMDHPLHVLLSRANGLKLCILMSPNEEALLELLGKISRKEISGWTQMVNYEGVVLLCRSLQLQSWRRRCWLCGSRHAGTS